ncbi:sporulation membrane protein YtaF [Oceanobacillus chungangensis]|uniref:Sporulation membrane protein YtaF n=1 Tax=Oceanobacillus chungangensis TaxID=1229152 RepID=A0A3D8PK46_9BACI|nr:sporulation membrane protein YtaF [Oceanobacillus chungangensis]RDW15601.1 sporulation membrane protein YtaF [Oceanobacillus chungangensis]
MLYFTGLFLLVIAVSLDGFGVGITYGMQKIKVPLRALFIIMVCSGLVLLISMTLGKVLETLISADTARVLGGVILITLGIFSLVNIIRSKLKKQHVTETDPNSTTLSDIKTVLSTPDKADLDQSGIISVSEAVLLGFALSLDAFGAGIGASMLGYSPILTAFLIASMSGLFLFSGIRIGILLAQHQKFQRLTLLPPALLIGLGIVNIIF